MFNYSMTLTEERGSVIVLKNYRMKDISNNLRLNLMILSIQTISMI